MLRKIRIGIALVVITLFTVLFLGADRLAQMLPLTNVQFVPSLLKFLLAGGGIASLGFALILVLTLLLGRVYCASLCPLGIAQDGARWLATRGKRSGTSLYRPPKSALRYGVLGATCVFALLGSLTLLNLLDPYSLFGRIVVGVFSPIVSFWNNQLVSLLARADMFALPAISRIHPSFQILLFSLIFAVALGFTAFRYGRLYCNTLCPVGTLLGVISRFSFWRIRLNQESCTTCGRCERICPAQCIESAEKRVDASRCVSCFNCLDSCPHGAISYSFQSQRAADLQPERRRFLLGSAAAGSTALLSLPLRSVIRQTPSWHAHASSSSLQIAERTIPVTPPGSQNIDRFAERCSACHLCVRACPTGVLQPAWFEYGLRGMLQPTMNYQAGYCEYDCHDCGQVCPTGAIAPLEQEEKQLTQIGKVQLIKERCIVHKDHEECGACAEVCPTHAVYTELREGISYPEIKVDHCVGCGRCEFVCPQWPKAIFVQGNPGHDQSKGMYYPQEHIDTEPIQDSGNEFPF